MPDSKGNIRIYVDGCFDVLHFGHANALRQAKTFGDILVVGVHTDEDIMLNKGPTVFNEMERYEMVRAIKWVDEVKMAAPYSCSIETLDKYECDFSAHGDDISVNVEGYDNNALVKKFGRYKEFQRTQGVSTTDLVERMLHATKTNHVNETVLQHNASNYSPYSFNMSYIPNSVQINLFGDNKLAKPGEKIVYAPGSYDLFHIGHIQFLKKCYEEGTYVIVGLYSDDLSNKLYGHNYTIMNIHERLLSVLSCRYVANVIIGAPYEMSEAFMKHFNIDLVVIGQTKIKCLDTKTDAFKIPIKQNRFKVVDSGNKLSTAELINRILEHRQKYEQRNSKKIERECNFLKGNSATIN